MLLKVGMVEKVVLEPQRGTIERTVETVVATEEVVGTAEEVVETVEEVVGTVVATEEVEVICTEARFRL